MEVTLATVINSYKNNNYNSHNSKDSNNDNNKKITNTI